MNYSAQRCSLSLAEQTQWSDIQYLATCQQKISNHKKIYLIWLNWLCACLKRHPSVTWSCSDATGKIRWAPGLACVCQVYSFNKPWVDFTASPLNLRWYLQHSTTTFSSGGKARAGWAGLWCCPRSWQASCSQGQERGCRGIWELGGCLFGRKSWLKTKSVRGLQPLVLLCKINSVFVLVWAHCKDDY